MTSLTIPSSIPTRCWQWMRSGKYIFFQGLHWINFKQRFFSSVAVTHITYAGPYGCVAFFSCELLMLRITSCISPRLFVHVHRVTEELKVYLNTSCEGPLCVQLKDYDSVLDHLQTYVAQPGVKVWIGTEYTNYALYEIITPEVCRLFILK